MTGEPTKAEKIRGLRWSLISTALGSFFAAVVFGSCFMLFLDELGMPKGKIGFILSIMGFCGLLALLVAPAAARMGVKRTFLVCWGSRKVVFFSLVFAPLVHSRFGVQAAFIYVAVVIAVFSVCRAIAETASFPWQQEYVPSSMRGKFGAVSRLVGTVSNMLALGIASLVIANFPGMKGFIILITGGSIIGVISILTSFPIPGGKPVRTERPRRAHLAEMAAALRDRNYTTYLVAQGLIIAASQFVVFLPLFLKEQIHLSTAHVISLPIASTVGSMLFIYLWGWAADRYGGKPVMLTGLSLLAFMPLCWLMVPRDSSWSYTTALAIAFASGVGGAGAAIGSTNLLYNVLVPPEKKIGYLAIFYAWGGLIGALVPLLAGMLVEAFKGLEGTVLILHVDQHTPLFALNLVLTVGGLFLYRLVRADNVISTRQFASMFLHGNPVSAFGAMIGYSLARSEPARVSVIERLGKTRSPLSVDQLLSALSDPSFNVRYEAIISIARTRPDDRLVDSLIAIVHSREPDLSIAAVWALGRVKATRATEPLREALESDYPLLQARSARELANLGDRDVIPQLLERFATETDTALRVAYASALGVLQCHEAVGGLLQFLEATPAAVLRNETALALARIVGGEENFMSLWRRTSSEIGTPASQAVLAIQRQARKLHLASPEFRALADSCTDAFAREELPTGAALLAEIIGRVSTGDFSAPTAAVLAHGREHLGRFDPSRREVLVLTLHAMREGLGQVQERQRISRRNKP